MHWGDIQYRRAAVADAFALMNLYQKATQEPCDPILLNFRALVDELEAPDRVWLVAERNGAVVAFFSLLLDTENRLAKLNRMILDPGWVGHQEALRGAMPLLQDYLRERVDFLYTTTRTLTMKQQLRTLEFGFKLLGVFPNAQGTDPTRVNGLSGFYFDGVLENRSQPTFRLHPSVRPFFEIIRGQCGLPDLEDFVVEPFSQDFVDLPPLELIHAPNFVSHRFARLNERRSLSVHFYPFQQPNVLITGPKQRIEVFIRVIPEMRFAAIIGERLDVPVNPIELYQQVSFLLHRQNITYIEMINDAGDPWGIEFLAQAGFLPCSYIPCFKRQGHKRRDYVVLSRSSEKLFRHGENTNVDPIYVDFLREYYHLEESQYLESFRPRGSAESTGHSTDAGRP